MEDYTREVRLTVFGPLCHAVLRHVEAALKEGRAVYPPESTEFFDSIMDQAMERLVKLQSPAEIKSRIDELEKLSEYLQADTVRAIKVHNLHIYPEDLYPYKAEIESRILDLKIRLEDEEDV